MKIGDTVLIKTGKYKDQTGQIVKKGDHYDIKDWYVKVGHYTVGYSKTSLGQVNGKSNTLKSKSDTHKIIEMFGNEKVWTVKDISGLYTFEEAKSKAREHSILNVCDSTIGINAELFDVSLEPKLKARQSQKN